VLRSINLAVKRLGVVSRDIHKLPDARERILEIVKMINFAVSLDEDLVLACIQLNQSSGHYPVRHCVDTAILATMVARIMKKSEQEIQDIAAAALTMNISILTLQEQLQDRKGALFADEQARIHQHPIASIKILHDAGIEDSDWLNYVLMHHEKEDGTGYPLGSLKSEIPQNVKILYLADIFCARISARGYRNSMLPDIALRDIFVENSAHVDTVLSPYFIKVLGLYPPGTFVCLKNKEVAVVSYRGAKPNFCVAHSLVKSNGEMFGNPVKRDTQEEPFTIAEAMYPTIASVGVSMQQIWGPLASL
jgi:HD-GYP domain-containing protein (c-di-GMP phosphodiesterase class II)